MPSSTTFGITEHLPALLMAAGVSLLSFLLLMNVRFKYQRRAASRHISPAFAGGTPGGAGGHFAASGHDHPTTPPRSRRPATIDDPRIVGAHETVAELIRELDTRCKSLEALLRQADERIRVLEDALDDRVGASISPTRTALPERGRRPTESPGKAENPTPTDGESDAAPPSVEVTHTGATYPHEPVDPLTANVCELADRGRSPLEIARYLDEQVGKVELILALRGDR